MRAAADGMDEERDLRRLPLRVALPYAVISGLWILLSDRALLGGDAQLTRTVLLNSLKGLLFVGVTAIALYLVLRGLAVRILAAHGRALEEHRRYEALIRGSTDMIAVVGRDGRLTYVSDSVTPVLGWTPAEVLERQMVTLTHPDDLSQLRGISSLLPGQGHSAMADEVTVRVLAAAGGWRHVELSYSQAGYDPVLDGVVVNARDVTDRVQAQQALHHARSHHPVTGLRNRQGFEGQIRDLGLAARAVGSTQLVVLVADVDRFREVNEEIGTEGGDEVLRVLADRVRAMCPSEGVVGHLGSDNLALAFPVPAGRREESEVRLMAEGLRRTLGTDLEVRDRQFTLSISCGAAVCPADAAPVDALLAAEAMCTDAKVLPDRVAIVVNPASVPRQVRAPELHRAISEGELRLHYQPQYRLRDGRMTGVEALIRWQHPERGLLTPAAFLDDAQARGLQPMITRWVLAQACAFLADVDPDADLMLSVNLSLDDLARGGLVAEVLDAVRTTGIDTARLRLELTERALLVHPEQSLRTMHELRNHGLTFSIDDFGTGYSSLEHLRTMPVDEVKIDQSFVADLQNPRSRAIVAAVIDLGHTIGLDLVAEGIEDAETARALQEMGCCIGQGYHLGRPQPPGDIVRRLAADTSDVASHRAGPPAT